MVHFWGTILILGAVLAFVLSPVLDFLRELLADRRSCLWVRMRGASCFAFVAGLILFFGAAIVLVAHFAP